jgi:galactose oxidase-like protein
MPGVRPRAVTCDTGPTLRYRDGMRSASRRSLVAIAALALGACATPGSATPRSASPTVNLASPGETSGASSTPAATAQWSPLTSQDGPPAREDHTWTVGADGIAYLFGGRDGATIYDDLWAFDLQGETWRPIAAVAAGPAPRFGHNAAWVPGVGLVVFAGQGPNGFFNDLWAFDPASGAWGRLAATGATPVSRYGSCAAIGPDGRLWISHGFTSEGQRFADTRAFDFATLTWADETPLGEAPIERCLHACWWAADDTLRLYGGQTTGTTALGDLWQLDVGERPGTNAWTSVALDPAPPDRNLYASARWQAGTLVFGGQGLDGDYLADSWWLSDEGSVARLDVGDGGPSARAGAELIADPAGGRLLLFGGRDGSTSFAELWQLVAPTVP